MKMQINMALLAIYILALSILFNFSFSSHIQSAESEYADGYVLLKIKYLKNPIQGLFFNRDLTLAVSNDQFGQWADQFDALKKEKIQDGN